jgi:ribokinase
MKKRHAFSFDVIVCGSLHLDVMVDSPHLPRLDETVVGSAWGMKCGGKGGNQAVMPARMGARTAMIGRIGADDFGTRLKANLEAAGVDHSCVDTDADAGSGMSVAILDSQGDYGAVIVSGSNLKMDPHQTAERFVKLGGAKVLLLQNEIPEAVNLAIATTAQAHGALVVLNAAPARPAHTLLMDHVDVLVVNRIEAEMLSGQPVSDIASATAAITLLSSNKRDVIVTLGGEGLVFQAKGREPQSLEPHKIKVASTHGAGDCFLGALAIALADGASLAQACETANQIAAKFVSTPEEDRASTNFSSHAG